MPTERVENNGALPPISGIARKKRSDAGVARKSAVASVCDAYLRLSPIERRALMIALDALDRMGADVPAPQDAADKEE